MRPSRPSLLLLTAFAFAIVTACSDAVRSSTGPGADGGDGPPPRQSPTPDTAPPPGDDAGADAGDVLTKASETEPNNGSTATEIGSMTLPGEMTGKLDPAGDVDVFSVSLTPGELWEWTLTPASADLAPHLTVFDTAPGNLNPTALAGGQAGGGAAKLDHFVLRAGSFVAAVRDTRNVPTTTGKGGPTYGYTLVGKRKTSSPVAVTLPATKSATLASLSSIDLYTFTGSGGKGFDIVIKAARKAVPSTLDSRISLFDVAQKKTLITNDDAAGTTDSQISSTSPATGTYIVVVENEGTDPTDLSYDIELTLKP